MIGYFILNENVGQYKKGDIVIAEPSKYAKDKMNILTGDIISKKILTPVDKIVDRNHY